MLTGRESCVSHSESRRCLVQSLSSFQSVPAGEMTNTRTQTLRKKTRQECTSEHRTTGIYLFGSFEHVLKLLSFGGNQMVGVFELKEERSHKHLWGRMRRQKNLHSQK